VKVALELVIVLGTVVGMIFAAFWLMEERHAARTEVVQLRGKLLETEAGIRVEDLKNELNDTNERRQFYDDLEADGVELTAAQKRRKMQLESRSEDLEKEKDRWTKIQDDLR
jgi:hypothetical protein